jgi:hypothetical protein
MKMGKFALSAVLLNILGLQLWFMQPRHADVRRWPFIDYPMYSVPRYEGATFTLHQMRVVSCEGAVKVVPVNQLAIPWRAEQISTAAGERSSGARASVAETLESRLQISDAIVRKIDPHACRIELWGRTYRIGRAGLEDRYPPERLDVSWSIAAHELAVRRTQ